VVSEFALNGHDPVGTRESEEDDRAHRLEVLGHRLGTMAGSEAREEEEKTGPPPYPGQHTPTLDWERWSAPEGSFVFARTPVATGLELLDHPHAVSVVCRLSGLPVLRLLLARDPHPGYHAFPVNVRGVPTVFHRASEANGVVRVEAQYRDLHAPYAATGVGLMPPQREL